MLWGTPLAPHSPLWSQAAITLGLCHVSLPHGYGFFFYPCPTTMGFSSIPLPITTGHHCLPLPHTCGMHRASPQPPLLPAPREMPLHGG